MTASLTSFKTLSHGTLLVRPSLIFLSNSARLLCQFARDAVPEDHQVGGINDRSLWPHRSGGWKPKVTVTVGPCSLGGSKGEGVHHVFLFGASKASPVMLGVSCVTLISVFVFTWPSPRVCMHVCVSKFLLRLRTPTSHTGLSHTNYCSGSQPVG